MKEHNSYTALGLKALGHAATKVSENAGKNNYKIPIWKNGRIEYEIPAIGTEQTDISCRDMCGKGRKPNQQIQRTQKTAPLM